jgi:putative mRNA 3-end processing factor
VTPLVTTTDQGLFCPQASAHIDPWEPVERALVTHAHSDHAHEGCGAYLTSRPGEGPLRVRVGSDARIQTLGYGERLGINDVTVSFHPAGHLLGSAQIRLEHRGQVWVISGDYKVQPDPTCEPFELVPCHTFITESTFGLPVYRWPEQSRVFDEINRWWQANQKRGWTSIIYTYALGKAQRLLAGINPDLGPIAAHGAVRRYLPAYEAAGVELPAILPASADNARDLKGKALIVAPQSAAGTPWIRKFAPVSTAFASGWMRVRGARRWRSVDRGFVLSDHADWEGLLSTIAATGAESVGVTHGYAAPLARWLREHGQHAWTLATRYGDDEDELPAEPSEAEDKDGRLL